MQKASPANTLKEEDYEKEFQSHRRLIRRIEALELRVSGAAPHDKVQRLTRRMEALESTPPLTKRSVSKEREDQLKAEVESLRAALKMLEDHVKVMQDEMKEMAKKMRTLPKVMANVGNECMELLIAIANNKSLRLKVQCQAKFQLHVYM